jgi:alpha-L-arabinofuranosidase
MEKMLFSDNRGTHVLPFTQNSAHCFWSVSEDTAAGKKDILLKAANNSATAEDVEITLKGAGKVKAIGHSTTLKGAPSDENSLANPTKVIPSPGTFSAGTSFKYRFPAYSVTVLRVGISK